MIFTLYLPIVSQDNHKARGLPSYVTSICSAILSFRASTQSKPDLKGFSCSANLSIQKPPPTYLSRVFPPQIYSLFAHHGLNTARVHILRSLLRYEWPHVQMRRRKEPSTTLLDLSRTLVEMSMGSRSRASSSCSRSSSSIHSNCSTN